MIAKKNIIFLIRILLFPYYSIIILLALFKVKLFNKNLSENEYQAMINLFLISNGKSNFLLHKILKKNKSTKAFYVNDIKNNLNENGYYVKENFISRDDCSKILNQSLKMDGYYKLDHNPEISIYKYKFDRQNPKGTMFFYEENELLNVSQIQNIILNPFLKDTAAEYFEGLPILSAVNMWWSTKFKDTPDNECAQNFHFDMDSLKWLKFFIYITDVNKKNGPHTFVKGSHKINSLPYEIRKLGYSRIDDNIVVDKFGVENFIEFDKPSGTLIIEDTKGLHKGKNVEEDDRLILQLEFTSSRFMKNTNRNIKNHSISNEFLNFYRANEYFMQFYKIK